MRARAGTAPEVVGVAAAARVAAVPAVSATGVSEKYRKIAPKTCKYDPGAIPGQPRGGPGASGPSPGSPGLLRESSGGPGASPVDPPGSLFGAIFDVFSLHF